MTVAWTRLRTPDALVRTPSRPPHFSRNMSVMFCSGGGHPVQQRRRRRPRRNPQHIISAKALDHRFHNAIEDRITSPEEPVVAAGCTHRDVWPRHMQQCLAVVGIVEDGDACASRAYCDEREPPVGHRCTTSTMLRVNVRNDVVRAADVAAARTLCVGHILRRRCGINPYFVHRLHTPWPRIHTASGTVRLF